jgi:hypothetical protein
MTTDKQNLGYTVMLISRIDLAKRLKVNVRHVLRMERQGLLPHKADMPGHPKYDEKKVASYLSRFFVGSNHLILATIPTDFLTPFEYSMLCGVSIAAVLRWARLRQVPHYRFGGHTVRFRKLHIGGMNDEDGATANGYPARDSYGSRKARRPYSKRRPCC